MSKDSLSTQVAVIGAGPGGYPAAFHAADLGLDVVLIDRDPNPGGVCLYRGCIPSKAFLHAAKIVQQAREAHEIGITFDDPSIDMDRLRKWKQSVVEKLTGGLGQLTKKRGITFVQGTAAFSSAGKLSVKTHDDKELEITFEYAIVATGSKPVKLPFLPDSDRIMDSTDALELKDVPERMLVLGGGYIGLELGQVYASLGASVSVVEMMPSLLPGVDPDLVKVLARKIDSQFDQVMLKTKVTGAEEKDDGIAVDFQADDGTTFSNTFDKVLVAVGRKPLSENLGLENTNVQIDKDGFVKVDAQRRTHEPTILAIGDVAGQPMLAHKATHEGRVAAEAVHGEKAVYEPRAIPAVVFTDPEIAWCGLSEDEARRQGMNVDTGVFPWEASGRAATMDHSHGVTKIVADSETGQVLGMGIAGHNAGELIGEGVLAVEMGAVAEDIALCIHAHPSLSETIMEAAENLLGQSTHFFQRM